MLFKWDLIDVNIISMGTSNTPEFSLMVIGWFGSLQPSIASIHM